MSTILPGTSATGQQTTLGVMGGGQLGRMFVQAAQRMGYFTAVLDPDPASPAGRLSHFHVKTGYLDEQGLAQMLQRCAAITIEFENVPAPALVTLGAHRPVAPHANAVAITQDRVQEKRQFAHCAVPCVPWAPLETPAQLAALPDRLLPGILKTARLGYDGKGQARVDTREQLARAWQELKQQPCVLEMLVPLAFECSVLVARGSEGDMVHYAPQRNVHRNGILAVTSAWDGVLPAELAQQAVACARKLAEAMLYVGVLCVEFFALDPATPLAQELGGLLANEMAPRPHNSGHYTQDACDKSQFDLQVCALAGLPLPMPRQHSPAIMLNLLGDLWFRPGAKKPHAVTPDWAAVLRLPGTHLHLYGKLDARPGRKMGHLNITGATVPQVQAVAAQAAQLLGMAAP